MSLTRYSQATEYITSLYVQEDEVMYSIRSSLDQKRLGMQLSPVEGKLLSMLVKMMNAKNVLEIGTLVGYSAIWIAKALPQDGRLISIEKSSSNFEEASRNIDRAKLSEKIKLINGDALDVIKNLPDKRENFDIVFIDADKLSYPHYLDEAYNMLRKGVMVIADNTFLFDMVFDDETPKHGVSMWESMRKFNTMLADSTRFESIIIPTQEGLSIGFKI